MQVFIWRSTHFADAGLPVPNCLFEVRTVSTKASLSVHLCVPSPDLDSGYHSIYCSSVKSLDSVLVSPDTCIQSLQVSQPCLICEIQVWSVKYVNSDLLNVGVTFELCEVSSIKYVKCDRWNTWSDLWNMWTPICEICELWSVNSNLWNMWSLICKTWTTICEICELWSVNSNLWNMRSLICKTWTPICEIGEVWSVKYKSDLWNTSEVWPQDGPHTVTDTWSGRWPVHHPTAGNISRFPLYIVYEGLINK